MVEIYKLLRELGGTGVYRGYFFTADAIYMMIEMQENPKAAYQSIYKALANKHHQSIENIERDMRKFIGICWSKNKITIQRIAGYHMDKKPKNTEFVDVLAYYLYLQRNR